MSHLMQKGRRRAAKELERRRRHGWSAGRVHAGEGYTVIGAARERFKMLQRSCARKWRIFDTAFPTSMAFMCSEENALKAQEKLLAYGRLWGVVAPRVVK